MKDCVKCCLCFDSLVTHTGKGVCVCVTSTAQELCKANKKSAASWGQKIQVETYNRLPKAWEEKPGRDSLGNKDHSKV